MLCGQRHRHLPHPDNPIQPTWTLPSELCLGEFLPPDHKSLQGSRYLTFFTDIFAPDCWRDSTLGCWREPEVPGENLVFHQALLHCLTPDQLCHQEEIGSNVRGSQCQA